MSLNEKKALAPAASKAIAKKRRALVSRGLCDLSKLLRPMARVLLVNDQRVPLDEMEQILIRAGYDVRSTDSQMDAISIANSFFETEPYCFPPSDFVPQFVMLGLTLPIALGTELSTLCHVSKLILWGEAQGSENLEQRKDHYDFELLSTPIKAEEIFTQMNLWIAQAWTYNGYLLSAIENHVEALQCHEEAIILDPLCFDGWKNKGYCLRAIERFPDALHSYEKAIEIDSSRWEPWYEMGYTFNEIELYEDAIRCFNTAIKLSPDLIGVRKDRGIALDSLGRYDDAITSYDEAINLIKLSTLTEYGRNTSSSDAFNLKGASLSHMSRFQDAIACYDRAISLDPEYSFPYYNKGIALMKIGHNDQAILWFEKALKIAPWHSECWHNKGICLRERGQTQEAITCFEKALACDEPETLAWYNMGQALEDLGQKKEALAAYEKYLAETISARPETEGRAQARLDELKSSIGEQS